MFRLTRLGKAGWASEPQGDSWMIQRMRRSVRWRTKQEAAMQKTKRLSLPIDITLDMTKDTPETSGLMASLRKKGFEQKKLRGSLKKLTFNGEFTGTLDDLKTLLRAIKGHPKDD